jgi:hypothetical protein
MLLTKPIEALLNRYLLRLQSSCEVARFDGIILVDAQDDILFRSAVPAALQLIKELDSRRYRRVQRYIKWIVNCPLPYGGGQYHYPTRTCRLDFEKTEYEADPEYVAAATASTLVHEATHGFLRARSIGYSAQLRSRVERCCVRDRTGFSHVSPSPVRTLPRSFIGSLANHTSIAIGLPRAFRAFLIWFVVFAEYERSNQPMRFAEPKTPRICRGTAPEVFASI